MPSVTASNTNGSSRDWGAVLAAARAFAATPRARLGLWAMAAAFFAVGLGAAIWSLDLSQLELTLWPLAVIICCAIPAMLVLNALETECVARLFGRSFGFSRSLRLTVMGSAANMLPLPGAAAVRVLSLKSLDVPARLGSLATLGVALVWLGLSLLLAAIFLLEPSPALGAGAGCVGALSLAAGLGLLLKFSSHRPAVAGIVVIKLGLTLIAVVRMLLCFAALGVPIGFEAAAVFAVGRVLGAASSIVPAGLGVRELVSAALAPLVGVSSALAFVATALDRLVAMVVLLVLSAFFGAKALNSNETDRS